jgi:hypothetical protein
MDLAYLSLRLENTQAIAGAKAAGAAFDTMGAKGELAAKKVGAISPIYASSLAAAQRAAAAVDGFGGSNLRAAEAATHHSISLGRVERSLESFVVRTAGANEQLGLLAAAFGHLQVGSVVMIGVLAALFAVTMVYEKLTESTRKAHEEQDKASEALVKWYRTQKAEASGHAHAEEMDLTREAIKRLRAEIEKPVQMNWVTDFWATLRAAIAIRQSLAAGTGITTAAFTGAAQKVTDDNARRAAEMEAAVKAAAEDDAKKRQEEENKAIKLLIEQAAARDEIVRKAREELSLVGLTGIALAKQQEVYDTERAIRENNVKAAVDLIGADAAHAAAIIKARDAMNDALRSAQKLTVTTIERTASLKEQEAIAKLQAEDARFFEKELLGGIKDFASGGLNSFKEFFVSVETMAARMVTQVTSRIENLQEQLKAANKAGAEDLAKTIDADIAQYQRLADKAAAIAKATGAAIAAASIGYSLGQSNGAGVGAIGGAAAGAAAGAQFGPWGAVAGGLIGAASGLLGAAKAHHEAADSLKNAAASFKTNVDQFAAVGSSQIEQQKAALYAQKISLHEQALAVYALAVAAKSPTAAADYRTQSDRINAAYTEQLAKIGPEFWRGINEQINALSGSMGEYRNALATIEKQYEDNKKSVEALGGAEESLATIERLHVRQLEALADAQRAEQRELSADLRAIDARSEAAALVAIIETTSARQLAALDQQIATAQETLKTEQDALRKQEQLVQATERVYESLKSFSAGLAFTPQSPLSPTDRLAEARRQYDDILSRAMGGDLEAASQFSGIAQTRLSASEAVNAHGPAYEFDQVQRDAAALTEKFGTQLTVEQLILKVLQDHTAQLEQQITELQKTREDAAQKARDQIDALNRLADITQQRDASTLATDRLLDSLARIRESVDAAGRATIDQQVLSLTSTRDALALATANEVAAIKGGADATTIQQLEQIRLQELARSDYNTKAVDQITKLAAIQGWDSSQVQELELQRIAYLIKFQDQIDAINRVTSAIKAAQPVPTPTPTPTPISDPVTVASLSSIASSGTNTVAQLRTMVNQLTATVALLRAGFTELVAAEQQTESAVRDGTQQTKTSLEGLTLERV